MIQVLQEFKQSHTISCIRLHSFHFVFFKLFASFLCLKYSVRFDQFLSAGNSGDASFPIRFWDDGTLSGEGSDKDGDYTIKGRLKWHHDRKMYWNLFETLFLDLATMNHKVLS